MKKYSILWFCALLMMAVGMSSCNSENDNPNSIRGSLYGEWRLVGWNDGGTWFEVDTNYVSHRHLSIEIPVTGVVMAYSMANEILLGEMTVIGNQLIFSGDRIMTQVGCFIMESMFFEKHIFQIKSYQLDGDKLKLYYSDDDYFVFTSDFDDSEAHAYDWKDNVSATYIGEVLSISDQEVDVEILFQPSETFGFTKNFAPSGGSICHLSASDLSGLSFDVGDKIAFQIPKYRRLEGEGKEYQCVATPYESTDYINDATGTMHYDKLRGWCIVDIPESGTAYAYYPMKPVPEPYQVEDLPVTFSGALYPTWLTPSVFVGPSEFYFVSITSLTVNNMQEEQIFNENKTFTCYGGSIEYQSRIGYDFDSALDSLIRRYEPILNTLATEGHYSGEGLNIDKAKLNVDFSYDNREFTLLTFVDKANMFQFLFTSDVIDDRGNYFRAIWPKD